MGGFSLIHAVRWTSESVIDRLSLGEDSLAEFKEAFFDGKRIRAPRRDVIADELAALGNGNGGTLFFSVSDAMEVRALSREQMDALEALIVGVCADSIHPR